MSNCDRFRSVIEQGAYIDATAEGYDELTAHAAACPDCAQCLADLRAAEDMVRDGLKSLDPGDGFNERVMAGIDARPARKVASALWRWAPLAAAAAILIAVLLPVGPAAKPDSILHPERVKGQLTLADGRDAQAGMPYNAKIIVGGEHSAFEVVRGVGLALRPGTRFVVAPESTLGYTRVRLEQGAAAVSVKTNEKTDKLEIALGDFAVLASDADFLIETRTNGNLPGLYVDRGRVVVSFKGGVSVVERGEHVALERGTLLTRVHAGAEQLKTDLATLESQCADLRGQISRYEEMVATYSDRRRERSDELEMAQEALAGAADERTAAKLGARINEEMAAVDNLDFVMGEHIAKMSALRAELPKRLTQLRSTRALASNQRKACKEGLAVLAALR
jgi:hypothetical protein